MDFYLQYHLGDCIFASHFLNKIVDIYDKITFYCYEEYHHQTRPFLDSRISLGNLRSDTNTSTFVPLWIGTNGFYFVHPEKDKYDKIYSEYYQNICNHLQIENPIKNGLDNLFDIVYKKTADNFDILVIYVEPRSGQYTYEQGFIDNLLFRLLSQRYKICFVGHSNIESPNIFKTIQHGLSVFDIAQISMNCDIIIAGDSGPFIGCLNHITYSHINRVFLLHNQNCYSYDKFEKCRDNNHILENLTKYNIL